MSRHYVACPPPVLWRMTLREIHAHLSALDPGDPGASDQDRQMSTHPRAPGGARRGR